MKGREFYIETKYDGERCQLHKQGDTFRFFSRNGFDFTCDYGESKVWTVEYVIVILIILSSCHFVILSYHPVILSFCYPAIQSFCHSVL